MTQLALNQVPLTIFYFDMIEKKLKIPMIHISELYVCEKMHLLVINLNVLKEIERERACYCSLWFLSM